jgi:ribosome-dependent ATPase
VSIVPSVIPILLIFIPAILTALSVVREKEMGSIINLYVTPVTRLEFMLGKQLPYIILASMSFILLSILATLIFRVPIKGNYLLLLFAAIIYVCSSTGLGLLMSSFTKNQTAALFGTSLLTMIPAVQYSGLIDPVSSMQGIGKFIGSVYPTTHFLTISQGIFSKGLQFKDLYISYIALIITAPIIIGIGTLLLKKQEK